MSHEDAERIESLKDEIRVEIEDLLALMREHYKLTGDTSWGYYPTSTREMLRVEYRP